MSTGDAPATASSLIIPLLSARRGWKAAERVSEDVPPLLIESEKGGEVPSTNGTDLTLEARGSTASLSTCSVCQEHQSRYTCPRCQTPYCSVGCYRNHTKSTSAIGIGNESATSPCSEAFYKNRVSSILDLEAREQKDRTQRLLNEHYQQTISQEYGDDEETDLSDQLYEMLQMLDERKVDDLSQEEIMMMMPPQLRAQFQRDVQEGKLQDLFLERWHPWWRRHFVNRLEGSNNGTDDTNGAISSNNTLDERLLRVLQSAAISEKKQSSPNLLFHLIDILYSFCWTLRLYHGLPNVLGTKPSTHGDKRIDGDDMAVDAAATFLQHSAVLNKDARYTSLEQVISECTTLSTKVFPHGCNAEWEVLVEDCALILVSHRLVGRALLEANDLLKAAIQYLKTKEDPSAADQESRKDSILRLRQLRKKLDFFLTWSQRQQAKSVFGDVIKNDLMDWVRSWKSAAELHGNSAAVSQGTIVELQIPDQLHKPSRDTKEVTPPLIVEVATKRRNS